MTPDILNSCIECVSILMVILNIRKIYQDKEVKGVSFYSAVYWWCYGAWFAYFCGALNQPISFVFCSVYVVVNFVWLSMFVYYKFFKK